MSNTMSTYELLYKGLSDEDRTRLQSDVLALLKASVEEANKALIEGVQKAATEAYSKLLVNPWPDLLQENGNEYAFLQALSDQIWNAMLQSKPGAAGDYRMSELIKAWSTNYPAEWEKAVGHEVNAKITSLEEKLNFERRINRREF